MFLSRMRLSAAARRSGALWAQAGGLYGLHQLVWDAFSDSPDRRRDFLYRLDLDGGRLSGTDGLQILALSPREPRSGEVWDVSAKPFDPKLRAGSRLRFSLRANPIVTRDSKRHDVVMDHKRQLAAEGIPRPEWPTLNEIVQAAGSRWLVERAEKNGFSLDAAEVVVHGYQLLDARKPGGRRPVRIASCDFDGILTVDRPDLFLDRVYQGFGPAKAFGMGLMLLKRG